MRIDSWLVVLLFLTASFGTGLAPLQNVQALSGCEGDVVPVEWNSTLQRHAMVPFASDPYWYGDWGDEPEYDENDATGEGGNVASTAEDSVDDTVHPEDAWMYAPSWPLPVLETLEEGVYTTMQIGNDSSGALRMNLSSTHRTTVCVNLFTESDNRTSPAAGDVYLMTSAQYERYESAYDMSHNLWGYWGDFNELDEALSEVPPEWRSITPNGWKSYRDVHEYEQVTTVTFSVALDAPELYDSLLGNSNWQDFYIVVDNWDNGHDGDEPASSSILVAEISVMPTERSLVLPTWTVPLVFFVGLAVLMAAPFVLNKRYMEAGVGGAGIPKQVPLMTQTSVQSDESSEE